MKKLILAALTVIGLSALLQACTLNTEGELLFDDAYTPADTGFDAKGGSKNDAAPEASPDVGAGGTGGASGTGGKSGEGGSAGSGGTSGTGGIGGTSGSSGQGGIAGASGDGGSSGIGGTSGTGGTAGSSGEGGSSGTGGTIADAGDEDAADVADAAEEEAAPDATDAAEEPDAPWPTSPCGAYPPTGYAICWVYDHPSYPGLHMGLAGGVAGPGHFIENEWKDPMVGNAGNCVASTGTQSYVLCTVDEQSIGTVVMFAGGLHQSQSSPTESNNWACDLQKCYGEVYAYHNGVEIGKYVNFQAYAKVHTVMHFVPNTHLDLAFNIP